MTRTSSPNFAWTSSSDTNFSTKPSPKLRSKSAWASTISQPLMDRCKVERNPISLAAVGALGDANLKCCIQMRYLLALKTNGSVRTLVRSVEESHGAETARRLIHNRYSPHTQNRQYALMQKIMMPAKLWRDHAEGFESGLKAWELMSDNANDVLELRGKSNMAPVSGTVCSWVHANSAGLRTLCCNGVTLHETLDTVRPCHGNGTSADDDWTQVDSLKKGKEEGSERKSHDQHEHVYRHQHVQELGGQFHQ